jgi:hypothetical protein
MKHLACGCGNTASGERDLGQCGGTRPTPADCAVRVHRQARRTDAVSAKTGSREDARIAARLDDREPSLSTRSAPPPHLQPWRSSARAAAPSSIAKATLSHAPLRFRNGSAASGWRHHHGLACPADRPRGLCDSLRPQQERTKCRRECRVHAQSGTHEERRPSCRAPPASRWAEGHLDGPHERRILGWRCRMRA